MKQIRKLATALLVLALCLGTVPALAEDAVWTTGSVNMRQGPGLEYKSMRTIKEGTKLQYDWSDKDERGVTWYHITYKGRGGWVSSKYAKKGASSSSGSSNASTSSGNQVKTTGKVNLRTGAGLDYKSLRTIPKGTSLTYDETKKDSRGVKWYHVSYKGKSGWISSKYAK